VLEYTRNVQAIFQDPLSALDPGKTISFTLQEPLKAHSRYLAEKGIIRNREDREKRVREVLSLCDLDPSYADRRPGGLSGGQRQRVCIAASLMLSPPLILADEAISALDVSVGSQILNLFRDIDEKADFAMLFISHNLNVVYYLCDRIAVLFNGQIVEQGDSQELYSDPKHPYTQLLLSAVPGLGKPGTENGQDTGMANAEETKTAGEAEGSGKADALRSAEAGEAPADAEEGCPYAARCPKASAACRKKIPLKDVSVRQADGTVKEHLVRCILA
jgi:ABC-type dipeptide/oligopeptide/nickel transport system ATPase component